MKRDEKITPALRGLFDRIGIKHDSRTLAEIVRAPEDRAKLIRLWTVKGEGHALVATLLSGGGRAMATREGGAQ